MLRRLGRRSTVGTSAPLARRFAMPADTRPQTVAICNSSPMLVLVMREVLELEGFATVMAHVDDIRRGAEDFLAFITQHQPAVIVWDISPPYDHNWRFFELIRQTATAKDCRFVVTTTNKAVLDELVGENDALQIVGKPFDLEALVQAVTQAAAR
jgi:CheY-like chemotaxis protein